MKVKILNLVRIILIFTSIFIFLVGIIMLIDFLKTNDTISIISAIIIFSVSVLTFMLSRKLNNKINDTRVIMKDKVNVNQEKSTSADSLNDKSSIKITYSNSNKEINNNKSKGVIPEYCYNKDDFVVLDFETTGFNSYSDRIVEVAALKYMGGELKDSFNTLINPDIKIPPSVQKIHGITDKMVADKPSMNEVLPKLLEFIDDYPIVAHNVSFDNKFLLAACNEYFDTIGYSIDNQLVDTVKISREIFPDLKNHKLITVAKHINFDFTNAHRAYNDAQATAEIYLHFLNKRRENREKNFATLDDYELETYNKIISILDKNNKRTDLLHFNKTSKYLDIINYYRMLRIKLGGKKKYIIAKHNKNCLEKYNNLVDMEDCPVSENGTTRLLFDEIEELNILEDFILESFDESIDSIKDHMRSSLNAEKDIINYLANI